MIRNFITVLAVSIITIAILFGVMWCLSSYDQSTKVVDTSYDQITKVVDTYYTMKCYSGGKIIYDGPEIGSGVSGAACVKTLHHKWAQFDPPFLPSQRGKTKTIGNSATAITRKLPIGQFPRCSHIPIPWRCEDTDGSWGR